ncbi:MAG: trigger factor [Clostridiales Family XIII bacterium]|jgi:trigger factor|nr:trigger factor [Clostridiales Family XIII bacterium]
MKATFVSKENNDVTFEIGFDAEEFENAQIEAYKKTKDRYQVNGFRRGKAPRKIIEQHYGEGIFMEEALDAMLQANYPKALTELDIEPIDRPRVEFGEIKKGEGFKAAVTVTVPPQVEVKDYTGVKIKDVKHDVTDEDVDRELEIARTRNARFTDTDEAAENGDTVNIDYKGFIDDVPFEGGEANGHNLKLGSGSFIPGFEEQLVGAKAGDTVDVKTTFPEEYHAEELKGKEAVFRVVVNGVKREEKPELDDEFAQDVSEFESLDEYKADIEKRLRKSAEERAEAEKKNAVLEAVYNANEVDVPDVMVEDRMDAMMDEFAQSLRQQGLDMQQYFQYIGKDPAEFRESMRNDALKHVKMRLIVKAVVAAENFDASDEETDQELKQMAEQYKMDVHELKKIMGDAQLPLIREDIKNRKAVDYMFETAVIEA